jgi:quinol monooxygenase YgiN
MFGVTVQFRIAGSHEDSFGESVLKKAALSLKEPECRRFDVCFSEDGQDCFLYELYEDRAFDEHLGTAHFQTFDEAVRLFVLEKSVRSYTLAPNPYA